MSINDVFFWLEIGDRAMGSSLPPVRICVTVSIMFPSQCYCHGMQSAIVKNLTHFLSHKRKWYYQFSSCEDSSSDTVFAQKWACWCLLVSLSVLSTEMVKLFRVGKYFDSRHRIGSTCRSWQVFGNRHTDLVRVGKSFNVRHRSWQFIDLRLYKLKVDFWSYDVFFVLANWFLAVSLEIVVFLLL